MTETVTLARDGEIAIVTIDNPPVNALGFRVREPLHKALKALAGDASVTAVVLACVGRTFVAGADITEFGKPLQRPELRDIIATLEAIAKPTVAAIHGTALGGGLELALGCHFRIADKGAKLGLPEVKLGLLPGGGGTVRLPRLVGPAKALKMIVSGVPVSASEALASGLVDVIAEADLVANAVALAHDKAAGGVAPIPVRDRTAQIIGTDLAEFDAEATNLATKARGLEAPLACAQSVRNAIILSFDEALAAERELFVKLVSGDQSRAQRHLFFAEREAAKVPGLGKDVAPREVRRVGVIGAGTMGGGIAMAFANGGIPVTLLEVNREALDRGMAMIEKNYAISMSRGSLTGDAKAARTALFSPTTDYADLAACDLVIEAVFEDMAVKKEVFSKLDAIATPTAVLATNTSYLDVNEIAASTSRPQDVLGLHFFSPANVMKLLEIVRGENTAPDVLATALAVAKRIGKVPVVVGVCHGFVGNRMLTARAADAENILLEGASPDEIDKVLTYFGWPMGLFQMYDLAGLDIGWCNRKARGQTAVIADKLCEQGRLGQKTGKGFYRYENDSRTPVPDPEVAQLIEERAREMGVSRRAISAGEIIERTLYPMVNEGTKILEERISARASDIDIVWTNGYGFPVGKGGPMFWADLEGLSKIVEQLEYWHGRSGKDVFRPSELLKRLAVKGGPLASYTG
jgi:3-hydroxyacyl-CoA dehydrogenase